MLAKSGSKLTEFVGLPAAVNELARSEAGITSLREHGSSLVESATKARADGQETRGKRGNEILAGTGSDNSVHSTGYSGAVISGEHENHFDELGGPGRET